MVLTHFCVFFFSSRRRHTRCSRDWSSDVCSSDLTAYITAVVRGTREAASLTLGASPRAGVSLLKAARAAALLEGRDYVIPDDVKRLAPAVLRHRVSVAPELELEGVTPDAALKAILDKTEVPTT